MFWAKQLPSQKPIPFELNRLSRHWNAFTALELHLPRNQQIQFENKTHLWSKLLELSPNKNKYEGKQQNIFSVLTFFLWLSVSLVHSWSSFVCLVAVSVSVSVVDVKLQIICEKIKSVPIQKARNSTRSCWTFHSGHVLERPTQIKGHQPLGGFALSRATSRGVIGAEYQQESHSNRFKYNWIWTEICPSSFITKWDNWWLEKRNVFSWKGSEPRSYFNIKVKGLDVDLTLFSGS